ncbi:MAG: MFS transporter [Desulfobacterales bacterium]|nr:MFS transporter [Desulfobacterales bacterium]
MSKTVKSQKSKIISWILYDFANTIYSFIVVTYYLPPLLEKATQSNFLMSFATIFSMIFAGVSAPILGALTDRTRAAKKWLIISTLLCCAACSGIGIVMRGSLSLTESRIIFIFFMLVIANYTYQVGLMFYNSFLPTLGEKKDLGKISGLGIALGYGGPLFILPLSERIADISPWLVFPFGGFAFFIFAVPMFIFIPERKPVIEEKINFSIIKEEMGEFFNHFRRTRENKNLLLVLCANFFAVDAINTAIIFMTTYLENAAWLSAADNIRSSWKMSMMFALIICSMGMSFFIGWLSDKTSSKMGFLVSVVSMIAAIVLGVLLADTGKWMIFIVSPLGGAGLGGIWTAGRKMMADITPHGKEGEYFGLYGMVVKISAFGTIIFAVMTWALPQFDFTKPASYKAAFLFQCAALILSLFFLKKVQVDNGSLL